MNGSAHGTDDFEPRREQKELFCTRDEVYGRKPQIQPEFRRRQRCLSGLKNRDVTGIAHDVWGTGIISKG